jgi:hypothetical protein
MVDALDRARAWLAVEGTLVDIHPTAEPVHLEVGTDNGVALVGDLCDDEGARGPRSRHAQAETAIATVLKRGWFRLEALREFRFRHYAGDVREMRSYTEREWTDAHFSERTWQRAATLLQQQPHARLWLREEATIGTYVPIG